MNQEIESEKLDQGEGMVQERSALVDRMENRPGASNDILQETVGRDNLSIDNIVTMTVEELKEELEKQELSTEGRKTELLARLLHAVVNREPKQVENESDRIVNSVNNCHRIVNSVNNCDRIVNSVNNGQQRQVAQEIPSFNIRDVEESLTYFSGDDKTSVDKWIEKFEDTSTLLGWNDLQKFIYGKRMLKGSAKQFISYEEGVTSWNILKNRLKQEFRREMNSAIIHSQLSKRHKTTDESFRQYVYAMQELASEGLVEERALIYYIIKGIRDEESNKVLLHLSNNLRELKINLQKYEEMKEVNTSNREFIETLTDVKGKSQLKFSNSKHVHCFKCGSTEHDVKDCSHRQPKCFSCNEFGHMSFECPKKDDKKTSRSQVTCIGSSNKLVKDTINDCMEDALVDTGSDLNVLREDFYRKIGQPPTRMCDKTFTGFGNVEIKADKVVKLKVRWEEEEFENDFYVIPKESVNFKLIIGRDLMEGAEVLIRQNRVVSVKKIERNESKINEDEKEVMLMLSEATDGKSNVDVVIEEPFRIKVEAVDDSKFPGKNKNRRLNAKEKEKEISNVDTKKKEKGKEETLDGKPTSPICSKTKKELRKGKAVDAFDTSFPEKMERRRARSKEIRKESSKERGKDISVAPLLSEVKKKWKKSYFGDRSRVRNGRM